MTCAGEDPEPWYTTRGDATHEEFGEVIVRIYESSMRDVMLEMNSC